MRDGTYRLSPRQFMVVDLSIGERFMHQEPGPYPELTNFDAEYFRGKYAPLLARGDAMCAASFKNEKCVGMIIGSAHPSMHYDQLIACEEGWFVDPEYRKTTLGMRLFKIFEKWAHERGCDQILMMHPVGGATNNLSRMYKKMGFKPLEVLYIKDIEA